MSNAVISVRDVSMDFNMTKEKVDNLKEYFIKLVKQQLRFEKFTAVSHVSFDVLRGEVFGIVGLNGSGKSTMLKIISGILKPTLGSVEVKGTISPLIELGAGFDPELTARENVFLNGSVLGFPRSLIKEKYKEIIDFAELHEFQDVAIKNFSSGMYARLGFSIATLVRPDILIVDEILSVGDFLFQRKCEERIRDMMSGGTTVILVTHDIDQIQRLCSRVAWLEKGKLRELGATAQICPKYIAAGSEGN
ncbi:MAG: ABC transporter ATP-binding protein [Oscillospiraceae bacterium]|jgi:ABC-2 type transport system ATP-binding protein/lipopolysaccharide transport system ATP-binding protein|nr:ABC transporter ATP-binding protein [Oscillospiraceae bacterium]